MLFHCHHFCHYRIVVILSSHFTSLYLDLLLVAVLRTHISWSPISHQCSQQGMLVGVSLLPFVRCNSLVTIFVDNIFVQNLLPPSLHIPFLILKSFAAFSLSPFFRSRYLVVLALSRLLWLCFSVAIFFCCLFVDTILSLFPSSFLIAPFRLHFLHFFLSHFLGPISCCHFLTGLSGYCFMSPFFFAISSRNLLSSYLVDMFCNFSQDHFFTTISDHHVLKAFLSPFAVDISHQHFLSTFPVKVSRRNFKSPVPVITCSRCLPSSVFVDISRCHFSWGKPISISLRQFSAPLSSHHFLLPFLFVISHRHYLSLLLIYSSRCHPSPPVLFDTSCRYLPGHVLVTISRSRFQLLLS